MRGARRKLVVFVTTGSKKEARAIAETLVDRKLAACASVVGVVDSLYRWQGKVQRSREALLMIKTTTRTYAELERRVKALHSYEVPEIIALPISDGLPAYLAWLDRETGK